MDIARLKSKFTRTPQITDFKDNSAFYHRIYSP